MAHSLKLPFLSLRLPFCSYSGTEHTERSLLTSGTYDAGNAIIGDKLMPGTETIGPDFVEMSVSSMRDDEPSPELHCKGANVR
jgi:hypothetical protein